MMQKNRPTLWGILRLDWCTEKRAEMAAGLWAMFALPMMVLTGLLNQLFTDFLNFWAAGRMVWFGFAGSVYEPHLHMLAESVVRKPIAVHDFVYPPPFLLICAPFGALPFTPALLLFLAISYTALFLALRTVTPRRWALYATVAAPALMVAILLGQCTVLVAALLAAGMSLLDRRPKLAGLLLGLLIIKPNLVMAVPVMLLLTRRWQVLAYAALSCLAASAAATIAFGPAIWSHFLAAAPTVSRWLETGQVAFLMLQSVYALVRHLGFGSDIAYLAQMTAGLCALAMLAVVIRRGDPPAAVNAATAIASLLMTPYLMRHDFVIALLPLVGLAGSWRQAGFPWGGKLMLIMVWLAPLSFLQPNIGHVTVISLLIFVVYMVFVPSRGICAKHLPWAGA